MLQGMATDEHGGETDGASDGQRSDHTKRRYMVGRVALRTKFFDTRLLEAVSSGPPAAVRQVRVDWICIITMVLKHPWAKDMLCVDQGNVRLVHLQRS